MTMQHPIHPEDERLAALAGGDPDASADASLRAHVDACDRCGPLVVELSQLRSALAELPDLVPSRLQLVPPAPAAREAPSGGWLRRLAAPMMAAGAGLVLVGAIGTSGVVSTLSGGLGAAAGASVEEQAGAPRDDATRGDANEGTVSPRPVFGGEVAGQPTASPRDQRYSGGNGSKASQDAGTPVPGAAYGRDALEVASVSPWAIVLLVGVVFLFAGGTLLVVRRAAAP